MSGRMQRKAASTSSPPSAAEMRRSVFSHRPASASVAGVPARTHVHLGSSIGVPPVASVSALPQHMQHTVAAVQATGAGSLESSSGLSKSLNDLDVQTGRLKEDNSLLQLQDEQRRLRLEISEKKRSITRLQRISEEMALVVQQHQQLQDAASKRERLGQTMRQRLEERCHKLEATNRQLTGQLEQERIHPGSTHLQARDDMKEELVRRDQMIKALQSQHDTCTTNIEQLQQQSTRLRQDMAWLNVLHKAVSDADAKLMQVEEELATAVQYTERLQDLESQFHAMTTSNQQRRSEHKMYMEHLDSQASELSSQLQAAGDELLPLKLGLPQTVFQGLEQLVSQRDQHINILSEEALKWRQLYMDEVRVSPAQGEVTSIDSSRSKASESPSLAKRFALNPASSASVPNLTVTVPSGSRERSSTDSQHGRHSHDLRTALQHQVQLEAGLKTLEHLIGEREVELSELLRLPGYTLERDSGTGSRFGQADDGGSRYSVAQSTSGFATPSSVLSCQSPAHALRQRHRWPSIGSQSQGNGLLSPDFEFSPSAAGSPMKTTPDGRDVPFPLFPTVRTNGSGYVGSKEALTHRLQDGSIV